MNRGKTEEIIYYHLRHYSPGVIASLVGEEGAEDVGEVQKVIYSYETRQAIDAARKHQESP